MGSIGNQIILKPDNTPENYPYIPSMSPYLTEWLVDGQKTTTLNAPAMVSSSFSWEKVYTLDFGVDFGFFDNRFNELSTGIAATPKACWRPVWTYHG